MVKLTVLYNLPEDADHDAYLAWRTGPHQQANASAPGVLKTDFYVAIGTVLGPPKYRYITEAYFATMADLEAAVLTEEARAGTRASLERHGIVDAEFLVSEQNAVTVPGES